MAQRIVQCLTAGSSADATVRKQAEVAITQMKASMPGKQTATTYVHCIGTTVVTVLEIL